MRRELWQRLRYQVLGLVFLLVAALFIALTLAVYHKAFTPVTLVKLETDRVGELVRQTLDLVGPAGDRRR